MIQYIDMTHTEGCFGIIPENGEELVFTGVTVNSMPVSVKVKEGKAYEDFAQKYGISFIFDDALPALDFYTIPRVDVAAVDDEGGFIGSVNEPFTLNHPVPLVYISNKRKCYLITSDSTQFLSMASTWKNTLTDYPDVTVFENKKTAKQEYDIIDFEQTQTYQNYLKYLNQRGF